MDMPKALGRKLTDSSCSEMINRSEVSPALFFFALKYTKSVKKLLTYTLNWCIL